MILNSHMELGFQECLMVPCKIGISKNILSKAAGYNISKRFKKKKIKEKKNVTVFSNLVESLKNDPTRSISIDIKQSSYDDFKKSQFNKNLEKIEEQIKNLTNLPPITQEFFEDVFKEYKIIYKEALKSSNTEVFTENFIKYDDLKMGISLQNWLYISHLLNDANRVNEPKDIKDSFKNKLKNTIKNLIDNTDDIINKYCKPAKLTEEAFKDQLIRDKLIDDDSIINDILEKTPLRIIVDYLKTFKALSINIVKNNRKYELNKLDYLIDLLHQNFIILLTNTDNKNENINIFAVKVYNKFGNYIINLISLFINGSEEFTFDWNNKKKIEILRKFINLDFLTIKNKKANNDSLLLLQEYFSCVNQLDIDFETCKVMILTIISKAYHNITQECSEFIHLEEKQLTKNQKYLRDIKNHFFMTEKTDNIEKNSKQKKLKHIDNIEKKLKQTIIKLGFNLTHYLRIQMPAFIGKTQKISKSDLDTKKKNYPSYIIEFKNCLEISSGKSSKASRPFLVRQFLKDSSYQETNQNNSQLKQLLNHIHNNQNGYLNLNDKKIKVLKHTIDNTAFLIFFYALINDFENYSVKDLNNTTDITLILNKMHFVLSLYYKTETEITTIFNSTNDLGKTIIKGILGLMFTFSSQTNLEKTVSDKFCSKQYIENKIQIKKLFNAIIGIKYDILSCIKELILYCNFGFYYVPLFKDSHMRSYGLSGALHMQRHFMIRKIVLVYAEFDIIRNKNMLSAINSCLVKIATQTFNDISKKKNEKINKKRLIAWSNKYHLNESQNLLEIENYQKDLALKQFKEAFPNKLHQVFDNMFNHHNLDQDIDKFKMILNIIIPNLATEIKSIKELPNKIIEFFGLLKGNPLGLTKSYVEFDATSNGLQMSGVALHSSPLAITSKLIEGNNISPYDMAVTGFHYEIKGDSFLGNLIRKVRKELPIFDYNSLKKEFDALHETQYQNKIKFEEEFKKLLEANNYTPKDIYKSKKESLYKLLNLLIRLAQPLSQKNKNKTIDKIKKIEKIDSNDDKLKDNINLFIKNLPNPFTSLNLYKLILDIIRNKPLYSSQSRFSYFNNLYMEKDYKKLRAKFLKKPILEIISNSEENPEYLNKDIAWFIDTYEKKAIKLCKSSNIDVVLTKTAIFKIRVFILDFENEGEKIFSLINERSVWKKSIMTDQYGSVSFGRIEQTHEIIKERIPSVSTQTLNAWEYLVEDYFYSKFRKEHLSHADILKKLAKIAANFTKETNRPIIIKNDMGALVLNPYKKLPLRVSLNSCQKELRGPQIRCGHFRFDEKILAYRIDPKKVERMFAPTFCQQMDGFIVILAQNFIEKVNEELKKKNIKYRFALETNHDTFRSPNTYYLKSIIELSYLFLIESDVLHRSFKDAPYYPQMVEAINSVIPKEEQDDFMNNLLTLSEDFIKIK